MSKHWNPKFKRLRADKVKKFELPNFQEKDEMTMDQMRAKMRKSGVLPPRPWSEMPIFISNTGTIFEPYIPPEGDGKFSVISKEVFKVGQSHFEIIILLNTSHYSGSQTKNCSCRKEK